jgi:sugar phosphate isomerase/epimerase
MLPGYNTNGFAHHRLEDAIEILAELGYRSVAITLDHHALNPLSGLREWGEQLDRVAATFRQHNMRYVLETGARFLLDPRRKHQPTLLDPDESKRAHRLTLLIETCTLARISYADAVSFWSGKAPQGEREDVLWARLVEGCRRLCDRADQRGVRLAFEPEPGMFIDTMPKFAELFERVNHPRFGLTLDVGHLCCMGELPATPHLERWKHVLWNVHIEDMWRGAHDHLPFGEGEIDFDEVFAGLKAIGYQGGLHVELSRHSHNAVETAWQSMEFLKRYL